MEPTLDLTWRYPPLVSALAFFARGRFAMKGFDDAVRLYEVAW